MAGAAKKRQQNERRAERGGDKPASVSPKSGSATSPGQTQRGSPPSAFDGNRDPGTARSRTGSNASNQGQAVAFAGGQYAGVMNKNVDVGAFAASMMNGMGGVTFPARPAQPNNTGREVNIKLNTFHVQNFPTKPVYQYDVIVGNGNEKRKLIQKAWTSDMVKKQLGQGWVFDGNKLAWSLNKIDHEVRVVVDMHVVDNLPPVQPGSRPRKEDKVKVNVRYVKQIDFAPLRGYLEGRNDFIPTCLEAISFFDHLMRQTPSSRFTTIKRNFFARGQTRTLLGGGIEAFKGVYASMRIAHGGFSNLPGRLSVNVDVANTAFWTESSVLHTAGQLTGARDANHLTTILGQAANSESPAFRAINRLRKVSIYPTHMGLPLEEAKKKTFVIDRFLPGKTARTHRIKIQMPGRDAMEEMTVFDYFQRRWNKRLQYPDLPVVQMTRAIQGVKLVIPMELCTILENQRFPYKLSDRQTTEMLRFAVTVPSERWGNVEAGLRMLDWGNDRYLANYGLQISTAPAQVKGRLLPNPKVALSGRTLDPKTSGRWNIEKCKFLRPFPGSLKSWGVCVIPGRTPVALEMVNNFLSRFIDILGSHGMVIANRTPVVITGVANNAGASVENLWKTVGQTYKQNPQILFFVVPDKSVDVYKRIKKSADCRYGVPSQVMQLSSVQKGAPQYCSNVAMKVNAKLGGVTAQSIGMKGAAGWFTVPTMIIGADVTHGAARMGVEEREPSVAAITMSFDKQAIKYIASVETNGYRVEMITKATFDDHLTRMVKSWMAKVSNGVLPQHVIYIRDGVSEGQYAHVLQQEVRDMKNVFASIDPRSAAGLKFTVIVGTKRHHVRFFPDGSAADRNGNAQPGTLVETAVTHPREFDFYLCAHSAIKGTARPVHYQVLLNEKNLGAMDLQNMIYEASYQYVRSTTPVSLHPAAYYAHLAAARGTHHFDINAIGAGGNTTDTTPPPSEVAKLLAMHKQCNIEETMWFV